MKKHIPWIFLTILATASTVLAHEGHEQVATNPRQIQWGLQGAAELINIHPLFIHFPIALLAACAVLYIAGVICGKENLLIAGKWSLYLGTLSSAIAVWTGLHAAETVEHNGDAHQIMMMHQYLGIAVLILSTVLSLWVVFSKANVPAQGRSLFIAVLLALAVILLQQVDLGGRLVFLHGVGVGRKSMPQELESDHHDESAYHHLMDQD